MQQATPLKTAQNFNKITPKQSMAVPISMEERLSQQKEQIRKKMGNEMFERVYKVLKMHKLADTDYGQISKDLKAVFGKNREVRQLCFSLEQIVFVEE